MRCLLLLVPLLLFAGRSHASSVPRSYFQRPINAKRAAFQQCYTAARARRPAIAGRVVTRFIIETDGSVMTTTTTRNDTGDDKLASCVRGVFLSLRFKPQPPEPMTVNYPVNFALGE